MKFKTRKNLRNFLIQKFELFYVFPIKLNDVGIRKIK